MRNKRVYNNLFDSICMTILFFVCLVFFFVTLWFGVINAKEGINPTVLLIISIIVFGSMITITILLIIKYCYEYWILIDDSIICKKLFSKRIQIILTEINKVEIKTIPALILGTYKSKAYIISANDMKIVILIREGKEYSELRSKLTKFINY